MGEWTSLPLAVRWAQLLHKGGTYWPTGLAQPLANVQANPQIGGRIQPISPICSADLLGFCIPPICSADLWGFCDLADSFCRLVGVSGILGHLIGRCHSRMCIIYFGTLDNTFSCSDWHHEVFLPPTQRRVRGPRVCGPLGFIVP